MPDWIPARATSLLKFHSRQEVKFMESPKKPVLRLSVERVTVRQPVMLKHWKAA